MYDVRSSFVVSDTVKAVSKFQTMLNFSKSLVHNYFLKNAGSKVLGFSTSALREDSDSNICENLHQHTTNIKSVKEYISMCENCREKKNSEYAKHTHTHIISDGLDNHKVIGNLLILIFVESQNLDDAHRLFKKLDCRTEQSWASLIHGYVECGESKEALELFKIMQSETTHCNKYIITSTLKACTKLKYLEQGQLIHSKILEEGLEIDSIIGNTLVDMYSKFLLMEDARRIFDNLVVQDIVSWNALIAGYAEQNLYEDLENCLIRMRLDGMSPDPITVLCVLKVLNNKDNFDKGFEMHGQIIKQGFEAVFFVANNLVHLYVKFGLLKEAREIVHKMQARNVITWTTLIAGYTDFGLVDDAFNCLEEMRNDKVSPNDTTYVCTLQACSHVGCIVMGWSLHSDTLRKGFERNLAVGNILVDMYIKCGSLMEAQEVFDKLGTRDTISWTALLSGYAENGRCREALICLEMMELEGVFPNATTFLCCLKACDISGNLEKGQEVYAAIVKEGFEGDPFIGNSLVDIYGSCGHLIEAKDVFDQMPVRSIVSWNILIAGYAEHGNAEDTVGWLKKMESEGVTPNATTLICSLKSCGSICALSRGQEIHMRVIKEGFESNVFFGNSFIDMYVKCGLLLEAQNVFSAINEHDVVSWTSLIAGYADCGLTGEVLDCFDKMLREAITPNASTFANILKSCKFLGAVNKGYEIHWRALIAGFEGDPFVASTLVDMYAVHGRLPEAQYNFDRLEIQNLVSWTALISGYVNHGFSENALINWEQMQTKGISPDATAYVCAVKACGNLGAVDVGHDIHSRLLKVGLTDLCFECHDCMTPECPQSILCNALVDMYCKCGEMIDALKVFDIASTRDLMIWNAVISGYALHGEPEISLILFHRMKSEGVHPDIVTYVSVLTACNHVGLVDNGLIYIEEMNEEYCLQPNLENYNCIIDLLARAGQLADAMMISVRMPFQPDIVTCITMLGGCRKWGNVELGRYVFQCMVSLDEKHLGGIVLMSNIYLDADMWESGLQVEELMAEMIS